MEMCNSQDQFQETDECISIHKSNWQMIQGGQKRKQLDESTARRHLKSPRSLSGRSLLTLDLGHQMVKITYDLENSNINVMAKVKPIITFEA